MNSFVFQSSWEDEIEEQISNNRNFKVELILMISTDNGEEIGVILIIQLEFCRRSWDTTEKKANQSNVAAEIK